MKLSESVLFKWYSPLPGWAKGLVVVGGMVGVYMTYKGVSHLFAPKSNEQTQLENAANDITKLSQTQKPSYEASVYDDYANTIYANCSHGDQLQSSPVEDTLKLMKNNLDVALLIRSFGIRTYYGYFDWFQIGSSKQMGLLSAVSNCFNNDYFGAFFWRKGSVNDDWVSKGITYQIP